ncbi:hypothetical protein BO79DRAFT_233012 [Aspergillus costaricaensis CBS 115574]|uniref:Uncharacterized protein n=1 Tax=Aspergillus costaricaensis CBS 115574 TaxID=1448317 RepID=A0ACD1I157_9EURO|nr:hypothetical protein BO79DRAFT_233012 [Aspergillus costaricaensis CBS 115574]RAK83724.1 hypothetical protein BO79DRAFT_233012 [Aspergillus costaricaensis CBS 115574]
MGRAWDTHCTATNTHPNSTGLGWVDGTGLGHLDTRLDTVDQTPTRDWPRLGGWDGPGTSRHTTRHSRPVSIPKHPHATGLGWVAGMGQGSDTQLYTVDLPDSYGSGLMVGWMGRAWKTLLYILTPIYDTRDNFSGPMVGWMGATTLLASWMGGWDGPGRPYYIYLLGFNTGAYSFSNKPGPGMGWAAVVDIGDPELSPPANQALLWVHTVNQASVGRLGRAWDIGFNIHHIGSLQRTRPRLGGWDGPGTSDTGGGGFGSIHCSGEPQALDGWLGRAWDNNSPHTTHKFTTAVNRASAGWTGRAWGSPLQWTRPRLGGWDGPGT